MILYSGLSDVAAKKFLGMSKNVRRNTFILLFACSNVGY